MSPSTLVKFLNDETGKRTLNSYTIEKFTKATRMPFEGRMLPDDAPDDSSELEFQSEGSPRFFLSSDDRHISTWRVRSRALELAGYLPGDFVVIDRSLPPKPGDVVVADLSTRQVREDLVIRIFDSSMLVAMTADRSAIVPILLNRQVAIRGVVIHSFRSRNGGEA